MSSRQARCGALVSASVASAARGDAAPLFPDGKFSASSLQREKKRGLVPARRLLEIVLQELLHVGKCCRGAQERGEGAVRTVCSRVGTATHADFYSVAAQDG